MLLKPPIVLVIRELKFTKLDKKCLDNELTTKRIHFLNNRSYTIVKLTYILVSYCFVTVVDINFTVNYAAIKSEYF